jgi:2-hydroxychromene-2-carboxylate isomerase
MRDITFFFDFVSPYAYLAFERLPESLIGHSYNMRYQPVLFAALLKNHGQLGPAEIAPKRDWTYRQVLWQAHQHGVDLQLPAAHPFNPLPLLRLAVACDTKGLPNRYVTETIFHHVWRGGADAGDAERLRALTENLAPARDPGSAPVKAELAAHTQTAIDHGVFGVPSFQVDDKLFWGFDALPMLRAYLDGDAWFDQGHWEAAAKVGAGVVRKPT